jgi:hypothetical protein
MQCRLDAAERFLAGEDVRPVSIVIPEPDGRLPGSLAPRAQALLESTLRMQEQVDGQLQDLGRRIEALRGGVPGWDSRAHRPGPTYFDRTA